MPSLEWATGTADTTPPSMSDNALTEYLQALQRTKKTLPYQQLICISASPSISTMAGLLRLATAVGPFIAVLQVHADIIDDWSPESVAELTAVARVYGFLIWEGGRVINAARRHQIASPKETQRYLEMARKRYTKGLVSVASWAGLTSTWLMEPSEAEKPDQQSSRPFNDLLIPTLKKAARETVNSMPDGITTEISGGASTQDEDIDIGHIDETREEGGYTRSASVSISTDGGSEGEEEEEMQLYNTTSSAISFTRTITQHTEVSRSPGDISETQRSFHTYTPSDHSIPSSLSSFSSTEFPLPPSTSRGVIVCTPGQSTREYSETCSNAASEHSDFVVGFVTQKPWVEVSRWQDFMPARSSSNQGEKQSNDNHYNHKNHNHNDEAENEPKTKKAFAVFAPLESEHVMPPTNEESTPEGGDGYDGEDRSVGGGRTRTLELSFEAQLSSSSTSHDPEIGTLHQVIAKALAIREKNEQARKTKSGSIDFDDDDDGSEVEVQYIPVISMNA